MYAHERAPYPSDMYQRHDHPGRFDPRAAESSVMGGSGSKYECTYCGKVFTRPSSLKVSIDGPCCWSWSVLLIMEFLLDSCE